MGTPARSAAAAISSMRAPTRSASRPASTLRSVTPTKTTSGATARISSSGSSVCIVSSWATTSGLVTPPRYSASGTAPYPATGCARLIERVPRGAYSDAERSSTIWAARVTVESWVPAAPASSSRLTSPRSTSGRRTSAGNPSAWAWRTSRRASVSPSCECSRSTTAKSRLRATSSTTSSAASLTKVPRTRPPPARASRMLDTHLAMWDVISHTEAGRKSSGPRRRARRRSHGRFRSRGRPRRTARTRAPAERDRPAGADRAVARRHGARDLGRRHRRRRRHEGRRLDACDILGRRHRRYRARARLRPLRALRPERRRYLRDHPRRPRPRRRLLLRLDAARSRDHLRPRPADLVGVPAPELLRARHAGPPLPVSRVVGVGVPPRRGRLPHLVARDPDLGADPARADRDRRDDAADPRPDHPRQGRRARLGLEL